MNNSHKTTNFSPTFQLKSKWLSSFCLIFLLFTSSNFLLAQPSSFTIVSSLGCSGANADGNYTQDISTQNSCPCYNNSNGGILYLDNGAFPQWRFDPAASCGSGSGTAVLYNGGIDPCDISTATLNDCDPSTTLSNLQYGSTTSPEVPTLSEWGLIILALLLMTLGTLYLVQPNWRGKFEQEG